MESTRSTDIVARYGGDEIAIVATNTTLASAQALAERIRQAVGALALMPPQSQIGEPTITPTVSIGVASLEGVIADAARMVECADQALYRAKAEGRNRVAICETQLTQPSSDTLQVAPAGAAA